MKVIRSGKSTVLTGTCKCGCEVECYKSEVSFAEVATEHGDGKVWFHTSDKPSVHCPECGDARIEVKEKV